MGTWLTNEVTPDLEKKAVLNKKGLVCIDSLRNAWVSWSKKHTCLPLKSPQKKKNKIKRDNSKNNFTSSVINKHKLHYHKKTTKQRTQTSCEDLEEHCTNRQAGIGWAVPNHIVRFCYTSWLWPDYQLSHCQYRTSPQQPGKYPMSSHGASARLFTLPSPCLP